VTDYDSCLFISYFHCHCNSTYFTEHRLHGPSLLLSQQLLLDNTCYYHRSDLAAGLSILSTGSVTGCPSCLFTTVCGNQRPDLVSACLSLCMCSGGHDRLGGQHVAPSPEGETEGLHQLHHGHAIPQSPEVRLPARAQNHKAIMLD